MIVKNIIKIPVIKEFGISSSKPSNIICCAANSIGILLNMHKHEYVRKITNKFSFIIFEYFFDINEVLKIIGIDELNRTNSDNIITLIFQIFPGFY